LIKARLRQVLIPVAYIVLLGLIAIFAHSGLQGDHGLAAFRQAGDQERRLQAELDTLQGERAVMQNRVIRLSDRYLDLDLLDERARTVLGLVRDDEIVVR
jgi:cell division protein FtsB